jgi:hypothetical protein
VLDSLDQQTLSISHQDRDAGPAIKRGRRHPRRRDLTAVRGVMTDKTIVTQPLESMRGRPSNWLSSVTVAVVGEWFVEFGTSRPQG